jgi:hypothetical protein
MKKLYAFIVVILLLNTMQAQDLDWAFGVGSIGSPNSLGVIEEFDKEIGYAITRDKNGNIYVAGQYEGDADFNSDTNQVNTLSHQGGKDIFVAKYDEDGNYQWAFGINSFNIPGIDEAICYDIVADDASNIYITGKFSGTFVDFNPDGVAVDALFSNGGSDIFIAKYNTNGQFIWAESIGGTDDDVGNSIDIDPSGNIYVIGEFRGTYVDFNPSPSAVKYLNATGQSDVFVTKFDPNGNFNWAFGFGNNSNDVGSSIAVDNASNVYITGSFSGYNVDFDPDPNASNNINSNGGEDFFIAKYDGQGNHQWAFGIGAIGFDNGYGIDVDANSNVYVSGRFRSTNLDFDPSSATNAIGTNGAFDIFLAKYNTNGNYQWAFNLGGADYDLGYALDVDNQSNVYLTGYFIGSNVDFDPDPNASNLLTSNGSTDIFVAKYRSNGAHEWAFNMGGTNADLGYGIVADEDDFVYVTGTYSGTSVNFDPFMDTMNLSTSFDGNFDLFVAGYKPIGSSVQNLAAKYNVRVYPNPVQDVLNIENGEGMASIYNSMGQLIQQFSIVSNIYALNTASLPRGQYILTIVKENGDLVSQRFLRLF